MAEERFISLSGTWRFALDREDHGLEQQWFRRALDGKARLPGTLTEQGIGDPITVQTKWMGGIVDKAWFTSPEYEKYRQPGSLKIPFWLQPELYYAGPAWFQRDFNVPKAWEGKRVMLVLERPHWETRVWVDGQAVGTRNSLGTAHEYDLGTLVPGKHTLSLRVDNRMIIDVGENSHSVSDHTQGNWNGIVGELKLMAAPAISIKDLQVYPEVSQKAVRIRGRLGNPPAVGTAVVQLKVSGVNFKGPPNSTTTTVGPDGSFEARIDLGEEMRLWDEFNPNLYELSATLAGSSEPDRKRVRFGVREISTSGTQFSLNSRPAFFRGTLECAIFPRTGHPPMDVSEWKRIISVAKAHGLNMIRFHSWCPPQAAFEAADELGFYFQVECGSWANQSTTLGDGKPVDQWIYDEADRILKAYGNHPSFLLFLYGNEPGGSRHKQYLARWVEHYKAKDPRRLVSSGAGWPELPQSQFHVTPDPRIQAWGEGAKSRINAKPPETLTDYRDYIRVREVPVISHEIGQWCVYPNFSEMRKYTGYLKPRNFEIFRERLRLNGMASLEKDFLLASGKLQTLCYKEDIESALRTPGMGGFQLLDLHDFPGQGTALVGVLDAFWEEKGYVSPDEYSRFCNSTVLLATMPKRVFTTQERFSAELQVAHFGPSPLSNAVVEWKLIDNRGRSYAKGELPQQDIIQASGQPLGALDISLAGLPAPMHVKLVSNIRGTRYQNDWDIWIYPARHEPAASDVLVTSQFDQEAQDRLRAGGRVLLTIPGKQVRNFDQQPVKLAFSSIFWNTAWTGRQAPTTLGIWCDPKHPALASFPTEFHSNWQWWYLIHPAGALRLDVLPETTPIVRLIDDWFTARPLALVVQGKVGPGKLVICGFDLTSAEDPVSRQMRASLTKYLGSKECRPATEFTVQQVKALFVERSATQELIRAARAGSSQPGYEPDNVLDGDPSTMWHTAWGDQAAAFPHELVLELNQLTWVAGLRLLPRQDGNRNGWIRRYEISISLDGTTWAAPAISGELPSSDAETRIQFSAPARSKFIRLRALSGHSAGPWASLAEVKLITPE